MPTSATANCVVIVDSIPDGHLNTARSLRERLRDIASETGPTPGIAYSRVESRADLQSVVTDLQRRVRSDGMKPVLHLEAHGWDGGIQLASGERISWVDLKAFVTPLNVATRLNLLLVLASCEGATFAKAIRLTERAPLWGLIGPTRPISAARIEVDFHAFYDAVYHGRSTKEMLEALTRDAPTGLYHLTSAEDFFLAAWAGYKDDYCSPVELTRRAEGMRERAKAEGYPVQALEVYRNLLITEEPRLFDNYREIYFMLDLYEENATRFDVTYERAEQRRRGSA